jgi:CRISPR/Cas system CSM-associated protein Csm3 (group 7 of RAMP superfamily)
MNTHRYIARIILEATTPLFVGSGESSLLKDALVQKDSNGMPMIQGTSLTGVLRHGLQDTESDKSKWEQIFGHQNGKDGLGSRLRISSAYLILNDNKIGEKFDDIDDKIKAKFDNLPSRQHVRINDKGVAIKNGLFDNEVVYKGTKFKFEIELIGNELDKPVWNEILNQFDSALFRVGQGTRNGYGNLKVANIKAKTFDLNIDFDAYTDFNSSLNDDTSLVDFETRNSKNDGLIYYKLELEPDGLFFNFSEGFGDDEVDNKPLEEEVVIYKSNKINFETQTVIPATSIKGAIAHRTAFHFNRLKGKYADILNKEHKEIRDVQIKMLTGNFNDAVHQLFGGEVGGMRLKDNEKSFHSIVYEPETKEGQRGKVIIDDVYLSKTQIDNNKIFNHVAIDRFTGGAMEGALFSEKSSRLINGTKLEINIAVEKTTLDEHVLKAFENALMDICDGLLPLGGMTTKGNGIFTGSLSKNNNENFHKYGDERNK